MPPVHPAAELFPMLDDTALNDLAADIKSNGLQQPVIMFGAKLLDGRNRWRACEIAGVEPRLKDWSGDDPVALVVSLNLKRRHLDESQRAIASARVANMRQGARTDLTSIDGRSQAEAAALLNVSVPSLQRGKTVLDRGADELIAAVESGAVAVSTAADLTELTKDKQREVVARGEKEILAAAKEIRARKNEDRRQERMETIAVAAAGNCALGSDRKYAVIYCDPPWRYEHAISDSRVIENQYPTMSLDEICALPVGDVSFDDCVLFMWTTAPKLREAMDVLDAWGFVYRTCAVWDKQNIGMGYYFRQQHELLLVATVGEPPAPSPGDRLPSLFSIARGKHSAKPIEFYEAIESMYPKLPKLEMFARSPRDGWDSWGNQSKGDNK